MSDLLFWQCYEADDTYAGEWALSPQEALSAAHLELASYGQDNRKHSFVLRTSWMTQAEADALNSARKTDHDNVRDGTKRSRPFCRAQKNHPGDHEF